MTTLSTDLQKLLNKIRKDENVHLVLPGAVVSGKPAVEHTPETICLYEAKIFTGASKTTTTKLLLSHRFTPLVNGLNVNQPVPVAVN